MSLRNATWSVAILLTIFAGCAHPADDRSRDVTVEQARAALLKPSDLPGAWQSSAAQERAARSITSCATSSSACGRAMRTLEMAAAAWGAIRVNVAAAYTTSTSDGESFLKQQIATDPDMDPRLAAMLRRQAGACGAVVLTGNGETVESLLRACDLTRGGPDVQLVQSWRTSRGRGGSTRIAYLFRGHLLTVMTFTSSDSEGSCGDSTFERITVEAAEKLDWLGQ